MLHNYFIFQSNALEGVPKISQKINEAHKCWKFVLSLLDFFLKWSPEHQFKHICVLNLSFHYQLDYLPLPIPCFCNCFSVFWSKNLPGRGLCCWRLCHSILSSPAASVLCPGGMWSHIPGIFTTESWPWTTPF